MACQKNGKVFPITNEKKHPDKIWCLELLSTLDPNHRFFNKWYYPSPKASDAGSSDELENYEIDNNDDFFTDIDKAIIKSKGKRTK